MTTRLEPTSLKSVGNLWKGLHPAKRDVLNVVELHKKLNPVRGMPILVGIDVRTGQLFFCSAKGSCLVRDLAVNDRTRQMFYEAWPQLRPTDWKPQGI